MRYLIMIASCLCITSSGCAQNASSVKPGNQPNATDIKVGGGCEGCAGVYESPIAFEKLNAIDTLPDFNEAGPKIRISGVVYQNDGKTPAANVVMYVYHTDQNGNYSTRGNASGWGKRHGYIRGWIRTGADGSYVLYTLVPASYPNSSNPKHIHPTIKEPGKTEYWIDEFLFDNDPLLPASEKTRSSAVGGSGLLKPVMKDGMLQATRDIVLGLNVKDYPKM
jgi:protocatechuate 3,4-dioxygenase beta subunit